MASFFLHWLNKILLSKTKLLFDQQKCNFYQQPILNLWTNIIKVENKIIKFVNFKKLLSTKMSNSWTNCIKLCHLRLGQFSQGWLNPGQLSSAHLIQGQLRTGKLRPGELSSGNLRPGYLSSGLLSSGHLRPGQLSLGNLMIGHMRPGQIRPRQLRLHQLRQELFEIHQSMSGQITVESRSADSQF